MKRINTILLAISVTISVSAHATVINIPADYPTIQEGINASIDGDTVLVQPGTYIENINFNGHNIVLGSLFLTTEDTSYISTTIIDGGSSGSVVTFDSGEDSNTMILGLTITNGFNGDGGGIDCNDSNPIIRYNLITGNTAHRSGGETGAGGGISCYRSYPVIENNTITQNVAEGFDGMGGGIYSGAGDPYIAGNFITDNFANGFLGVGAGGGIACYGQATIINNIITGNNAAWNGVGGGVLCINQNPQIINNTISQNTSSWIGAGICLSDGQGIVNGNIITGNIAAGRGGGIDCFGSNPVFMNNTVTGNSAADGGAGICSEYGSNPFIVNTIFWDNEPQEILLYESGTIQLSFCDIQGGWEGEGNIDCEPQFCGPENDDFYLHTSSCCLGAGENGVDIGALGVGCGLIPCGDYIVGDFNGSGEFNVADIIDSYSRLATGSPDAGLICECPPGSGNGWAVAMDVNNSCVFNVADIIIAYQRLALGWPELEPCEHCQPSRR